MANLGVVYEIDTTKGMKNKYPIVYANKSYFYCKQYGSDMLRWFSKQHCISLEEYNKKIKAGRNFYGKVFVSIGDIEVPGLSKEIIFTLKIKDLEKELFSKNLILESKENAIEESKRIVEQLNKQIQKIKKDIAKYEEKLLNLKKEKNSDV